MASILALLSICHVTQATNWFIATPIPLKWNEKDVSAVRIDISLQYEIDSKPVNWLIKSDVGNTGSYNLISSDFNLLSTASQVNITQNSTGKFIVSSPTQSTDATETLHILQTMLLSKSVIGAALNAPNTNTINTLSLMIANNYCNLTKYKIYASLIQLNTTTLQWTTQNDLNIKADDILTGSLYCTVPNVSYNLKTDSLKYGGPWFLQIGLLDISTSTATNYYTVNSNKTNLNDELYQFIVYNGKNVSFQLSQYKNIKKYENIALNVGNGLDGIDIYISLVDQTNKQSWFFNCGQKTQASFFKSFGWQFLNGNGRSDAIPNGAYLFDMYWAVMDNKSEPEAFKILSNKEQNPVMVNSSSSIVAGVVLTNENDFKFHPGDRVNLVIENSSFQMPINLTIWFWQCIGDNCNVVGPGLKVLYAEKNENVKINVPQGLQTDDFITDLKTYMNVTIDSCLQKNVSVLIQNVAIIPFYKDYILGNVISNISWNASYFGSKTILECKLLYKNDMNKAFNVLSLGDVQNNGSFNALTPDFNTNAKHLLINNNASGLIQLSSISSAHSPQKILNMTGIVYTLYQPLIISQNINGSTIPYNISTKATTILSISGLIEQSVFNTVGLNWNVYLTNIKDAISLEFETRNQYALQILNVTVPDCSKQNNIYETVTYCPYTITFGNIFAEINASAQNGTYLLTINYCKNTSQTPYYTNYYAINNFTNNSYYYSPFLLYSPNNITLSMNNILNGTINVTSYQEAAIKIDIPTQPAIKSIYAVLEDTKGSNTFIMECGAYLASYYNSVGWRFEYMNRKNNENNEYINIVNGSYVLNLYWNTSTTSFISQYKLETYNLSSLTLDVTILNNDSNKYIDIIQANEKDNSRLNFKKGNIYDIYFTASLNSGVIVEIYFQQCHNDTGDLTECKNFYSSDDNKPQSFIFEKDNQVVQIKIPSDSSLKDDKFDNYKLATSIVMNVPLCNTSNMITTKQDISIFTNSSSQKLTAGAIIAIIISGVLVLGLVAWWIWMRNSSGDGYRTLNE